MERIDPYNQKDKFLKWKERAESKLEDSHRLDRMELILNRLERILVNREKRKWLKR